MKWYVGVAASPSQFVITIDGRSCCVILEEAAKASGAFCYCAAMKFATLRLLDKRISVVGLTRTALPPTGRSFYEPATLLR